MTHRTTGSRGRHGVSVVESRLGAGRALAVGVAAAIAFAAALSMPLSAAADPGRGDKKDKPKRAWVAPTLAAADSGDSFHVIVQGHGAGAAVDAVVQKHPGKAKGAKKQFSSIPAVSAELTGEQIAELAEADGVDAITVDIPVAVAARGPKRSRPEPIWNAQKWPFVSGVAKFWRSTMTVPAIAIVDSGIDGARSDFGGRVIHSVDLGPTTDSPGDGRGHGTFVASIAAGSASGYAGAAPTAPLVSIDVVDDAGMAWTSDVIEAADWILANKSRFNIRVANFSLHSTAPASFLYDPLDRAVERLWFSGVVVVTAAGNYAEGGQPSGVRYAPANDPFVITVGAVDTGNTLGTSDDVAAPWSSYGYTYDGFAKPELGAPGRYLVGAVPPSSTLALEKPCGSRPDYIRMSGTSFAAPVVAGAAANLLAARPNWTPDQVKGALMASAAPLPASPQLSVGVGTVRAHRALAIESPPNPNAALNSYLVSDPSIGGLPMFDAASWTSAAQSSASWSSASWSSASWSSASWSSASWSSASWSSASWSSASWSSASWSSASWSSASWSSASVPNSALDDVAGCGGYTMTMEDVATAVDELSLAAEAADTSPTEAPAPAAATTPPSSKAAPPSAGRPAAAGAAAAAQASARKRGRG
jgi:serine protease AprX